MSYLVTVQFHGTRITFLIAFLALNCIPGFGQSESDLPAELGSALGVYQLNTDRSVAVGFEDFESFTIEAHTGQNVDNPVQQPSGTINVAGYLTASNIKFKFQDCKL